MTDKDEIEKIKSQIADIQNKAKNGGYYYITEGIFDSSKTYFIKYMTLDGRVKEKFRFKGISKSAVFE